MDSLRELLLCDGEERSHVELSLRQHPVVDAMKASRAEIVSACLLCDQHRFNQTPCLGGASQPLVRLQSFKRTKRSQASLAQICEAVIRCLQKLG